MLVSKKKILPLITFQSTLEKDRPNFVHTLAHSLLHHLQVIKKRNGLLCQFLEKLIPPHMPMALPLPENATKLEFGKKFQILAKE